MPAEYNPVKEEEAKTRKSPGLIDAASYGDLSGAVTQTTNDSFGGGEVANTRTQASTAAAPAAKKEYTPAEATQLGLGWVDSNHPLYGTAGYVGSENGAGSGSGGGNTNSYSNAGSVESQANAASTYSSTPGAAPTQNTTNQGTQDVVRNTLLDRATQGTVIDRMDPTFRGQADAYAAASERARRNAVDESAASEFANGTGFSGGLDTERRGINEAAAQGQASFEGTLAQQELTSRRAEIQAALDGLLGAVSDDQKRDLTKQAMDIDAAIKRESLAATTGLAQQDLALRGQLGNAGLDIDRTKTTNQNKQFYDSLGLDASYKEGLLNNQALADILG